MGSWRGPGEEGGIGGAGAPEDGEVAAESAPLFFLDGRTLQPLRTAAGGKTAILAGTTVKLKQEAADLLTDQFPAVLETNAIAGRAMATPWYVDTRLIFLRTDILAGFQAGLETVLVLSGVSKVADIDRMPFRPNHIFDSVVDIDIV